MEQTARLFANLLTNGRGSSKITVLEHIDANDNFFENR